MKVNSALKIVVIAGIFFVAGRTFAQKKWPGVVLYIIDRNGISQHFIVDPVVRISKGEFSYPVPIPADTWDRADSHEILEGYFDRFCREEYPRGKKLDLYLDGYKSGSVKITELDTLNSCSPVVSEVKVSYFDSAAHHFSGHGLVISSLPPQKPIRIFPIDSAMKKKLFDYGKSEFIRRGVKKEIAASMNMQDVRAVDLDGDGKPEYLVTYFINGEDVTHDNIENNIQYSLCDILKPAATGFTQVFSEYPDPEIPEKTHIFKLIDVLDLDGDGVCEVVIENVISMSRWDYIVLKKKGDVWEEVYEGAGGGC